MAPSTKIALSVLASTSLVGTAAWASHVREGARVFTFELTGEAECNTAGTACDLCDDDGTGTLTLYVNPCQKRICYDLTLAERFGPLDADSKSYQTWAELYLRGASFWELDWSQAVYYFAQVAPAMPNLADGSGLTATERYRQSLKGYGETFAKEEDWCNAAAQYEAALALGIDDELQEAYDEAAQNCAGVEDEEEEPEAPAATESPVVIPSETAPAGVTPAPTEVTPEAPPATEAPVATEAPPSTESPVVTEPPPQEPSATPGP